MNKILILILIGVLFFGNLEIAYFAMTNSDFDVVCIFEPKPDGYVHMRIAWALLDYTSLWWWNMPVRVENFKAWEEESGKPIDVLEADEGDYWKYTLEFGEVKRRGFRFIVEFDKPGEVEEKYDKVYYFSWSWKSGDLDTLFHTTVIIPRYHELIFTNYMDPTEVYSLQSREHIVFSQVVPEGKTFRFGVMFSKKGIQFLKKAEDKFNLGQYNDAKKAYQDSIEFYSQFSELHGKAIDEFLAELHSKISECEKLLEEERIEKNAQLAEEKFEESIAAFNSGDCKSAVQLFKQAQNIFNSISNSAKASECQDYIEKCEEKIQKKELREEADFLFEQGKQAFEKKDYESAKSSFQQAKQKYQEIGDTEKVAECDELIQKIEKEAGIGVLVVLVLFLLGILILKKYERNS